MDPHRAKYLGITVTISSAPLTTALHNGALISQFRSQCGVVSAGGQEGYVKLISAFQMPLLTLQQ